MGGSLQASAPCDRGLALLLSAPAWALSAIRETIPQPPSHGSETPGVLLPW
ncbi:hypothetical protein [Leptolyngbya sp. 'hensonii']|uniref:hypothetical protein n=1 Tax=Leptolyngbya sp. 'hensonii' TaxID=1922337 RepID=UPI0015C578E5|nr:hypothetical protein [Leptolyngbya sp. 'hensonii']